MRNQCVKILCSVVLLLLLCSAPALAHKVNVFAFVEGDTVYTESYFPDGRPVEGGVIEVFGPGDKKLLEGRTDNEGKFSFALPARQDLTIVINASMGHRNSYLLKKEEQ